jgi:hypothetical protein
VAAGVFGQSQSMGVGFGTGFANQPIAPAATTLASHGMAHDERLGAGGAGSDAGTEATAGTAGAASSCSSRVASAAGSNGS